MAKVTISSWGDSPYLPGQPEDDESDLPEDLARDEGESCSRFLRDVLRQMDRDLYQP